ncbi:MAG: TatD family hydrolase [Chitinophagaceae bacterium]|nr:TatD family hydrolase [Chitinophagaceae bacterium]
MTYIDVHTHFYKPSPVILSIENIHHHFQDVSTDHAISVGLHPWYLNNAENEMNALTALAQQPNIAAIGECGLDKLVKTDWNTQVKFFEQQLQLATYLNKPVIIHCVKAFSEVLFILKGITVPVIFHGINNKLSIVQPVIEQGYYLSFGKSLLYPGAAIIQTLNAVPASQLFLETDDTGISIKEIYKSAAEIRNITENEIALQLQKNFDSVFNYAGY